MILVTVSGIENFVCSLHSSNILTDNYWTMDGSLVLAIEPKQLGAHLFKRFRRYFWWHPMAMSEYCI